MVVTFWVAGAVSATWCQEKSVRRSQKGLGGGVRGGMHTESDVIFFRMVLSPIFPVVGLLNRRLVEVRGTLSTCGTPNINHLLEQRPLDEAIADARVIYMLL